MRDEHGDAVCLIHGTVWAETRAWDLIDEPPPQSKRHLAPNAGRPWTRADREWVIENRDQMSSRALAEALGRTEHSINQMLSKRALRKARATNLVQVRKRAKTLDRLEDAARPGATRRVARRLGLTYWAAYLRMYRVGVLVREADGMMSEREVARLYGCSRNRVRTLMRRGVLPFEKVGRFTRIDPREAERAARLLRARSKHDPRRHARKVQLKARAADTTLPRKNRAQNSDVFFTG